MDLQPRRSGTEPSPFSAFATTQTEDAHEHACSLQQWIQTYEQLSPGRFNGEIEEAWFGNVQVFRERTNQMVLRPDLPGKARGHSGFR
jgi:AraC family ethanolamine operon transcriptional activator